MRRKRTACRVALVLLVFLLAGGVAGAATISITGSLDTPNDALLYEFELSTDSDVVIETFGYGGGVNGVGMTIPAGGFDPYVTLFSGWGDTATFLASNDDAFWPDVLDSYLSAPGLAAGQYTLGLSVTWNLFWAEQYPDLYTRGDGVVGLYDGFTWDDMGRVTSAFAVDITYDESGPEIPVPEPATLVLTGLGLLGLARRGRLLRRR